MNEKSLIRPELNLTLTEKNDCNYYHLTIIYSYSCANYLFIYFFGTINIIIITNIIAVITINENGALNYICHANYSHKY